MSWGPPDGADRSVSSWCYDRKLAEPWALTRSQNIRKEFKKYQKSLKSTPHSYQHMLGSIIYLWLDPLRGCHGGSINSGDAFAKRNLFVFRGLPGPIFLIDQKSPQHFGQLTNKAWNNSSNLPILLTDQKKPLVGSSWQALVISERLL